MLTTRASKRDKVGLFNTDMMFDVMDGERQVGGLVYVKKNYTADIAWGDRTYKVARVRDEPDDNNLKKLTRLVTEAEKPPPNPWALKDSEGKLLALGEQIKTGFAVSRGGENFDFRQVKRPYHLFRHGSDQSLGSVGQAKFFTKILHMDLPAEFDPPFQVYLLSLVLTVTMQQLDNAST